MSAPIMPCLSLGEIKDSYARAARWMDDAKAELEAIRAGVAMGIHEPWHLAYATELRATALSLAGILGAIPAAAAAAHSDPKKEAA